MLIRDAVVADLPAIVAIYNATIAGRMATADLEPISVASRLDWFHAHNPAQHPIWVMDMDASISPPHDPAATTFPSKGITGWLSLQPFYGRAAYAQTAEVSIYVARDRQRQGIGHRLMQRAIDASPQLGLVTLLGFIFAHNQPSLSLFTNFRFQQWGLLPQIATLDQTKRDLIIMGLRL